MRTRAWAAAGLNSAAFCGGLIGFHEGKKLYFDGEPCSAAVELAGASEAREMAPYPFCSYPPKTERHGVPLTQSWSAETGGIWKCGLPSPVSLPANDN